MWQDIESVLHHPAETTLPHSNNGGHLSDFTEYPREPPSSTPGGHQPHYYYDLAAASSSSGQAATSSTSTSYELDLSVHSNSAVKCEPDTTHKDTKMDDISSSTNEARSPYMDLYATNSDFGHNNNDLPKLDPINYYENNHR